MELVGVKRENQELRAENVDLEHKLNEAYNLIDDLEFEMESVRQICKSLICLSQQLIDIHFQLDYAEADRDHFEKELRAVRQELANLQSATPKSAFHVMKIHQTHLSACSLVSRSMLIHVSGAWLRRRRQHGDCEYGGGFDR